MLGVVMDADLRFYEVVGAAIIYVYHLLGIAVEQREP